MQLDRVVFLPACRPPHKQSEALLDPGHRAEMVKLAVAGEDIFEFSDFDLHRSGPSYTIETVAHFRKEYGQGCMLHWIIGADSLGELPLWYRVTELVDNCRIVTAHRPGWDSIDWNLLQATFSDVQCEALRSGVVTTPRIEISSTDIRRRRAQGKSIRHLVPDNVCEYIETHDLYG